MQEIRLRVLGDIASLKQSAPPNFVPMVAYSTEKVAGEQEYCFLYNLGSGNISLKELLADEAKRHQMTWTIRVKIMRDVASAVSFLRWSANKKDYSALFSRRHQIVQYFC